MNHRVDKMVKACGVFINTKIMEKSDGFEAEWQEFELDQSSQDISVESTLVSLRIDNIQGSIAEKVKKSIFLRGLKGKRVYRALKSLLGDPVINGSHHKFRCRDGSTYPIPIHGNRDVKAGMLNKCLKRYGITTEEFVAAL